MMLIYRQNIFNDYKVFKKSNNYYISIINILMMR